MSKGIKSPDDIKEEIPNDVYESLESAFDKMDRVLYSDDINEGMAQKAISAAHTLSSAIDKLINNKSNQQTDVLEMRLLSLEDKAGIGKGETLSNDVKKRVHKLANKAKDEYVYIIGSIEEGICKIGYSKTPERRIKAIQTGCPYKLEILCLFDAGMDYEDYLHEVFDEYNTEGEWFKIKKPLLEFINNNRKEDGKDIIKPNYEQLSFI